MEFLQDGQSEVDSVSLRIRGLDVEIKTWQSYSVRHDFLTPTAAFDFTFATNAPLAYDEVFQENAEVSVSCNNELQMTGLIERVRKGASREGGVVYTISGRDILGPVVSASIDPKIRISANQTVLDFLTLVLGQFGISKVYVGDNMNYLVVTGYQKGKGGAQTKTSQVKELVSRKISANGLSAELVYKTSTFTQVVSRNRPDLKAIPLDQLKPKIGDGAMQVIERLLHRLGLQIFAMADGSGVVVDSPDYVTAPVHRLIRRFDGQAQNNVLAGEKEVDAEAQPSCVLAVGQSSGSDMAKIRLKAIAVNELVAVNPDGSFAPHVQDLIARYPGVRVLPLRRQLIPPTNRIVSRRPQVPVILKDDESKSIEQIEAYARRKLAEFQRRMLTATYVVKGHTYEGSPWSVNTNVHVDDDFLNIHDDLWVLNRTFTKSRDAGTRTELSLIRPYTLELGQ